MKATVVFIEEIQTKNGVKEKKVRKTYLVECDSIDFKRSMSMSLIHHLCLRQYPKQSKIVDVIE